MVLAEWGSAALGAFISGLIGVIAVEYRSVRTEYTERRQWYDKLIRLAERTERAVVADGESDQSGRGVEGKGAVDHAELTHGIVASELHQHIGNAPPVVSSDLLQQAETVARLSKFASENASLRDSVGFIGTHFELASETAIDLKEKAKSERRNVGFLWL